MRLMGSTQVFNLYALDKKFIFAHFSEESDTYPYGFEPNAESKSKNDPITALVEDLKVIVYQLREDV